MWTRERPHGPFFWSNVLNNFDEDERWNHFHMSQNTFDFVAELVDPHLRCRTTNWRKTLEPRLRLAVALGRFATPGEHQSIVVFLVWVSPLCVYWFTESQQH